MIDSKNKLDLSVFDKALIVLSTVGIIVTSYSLYNESLIRKIFFNQNITNEKIGSVFDKENDVRRRVSRSLMWFDINDSEDLYEGDTIFTGKDSKASLRLNEGSTLTLSSNSLVVLKTKDEEISLDLKVGSFLAKLNVGQKLTLIQNGKVAKLSLGKAGEIKIKKNKKGHLSIQGKQLQINAGNKKHATSAKGNVLIKIDENFNITKQKINISLLSPPAETLLWKPYIEKKYFLWEVSKTSRNTSFTVEVFKDEALKNMIWSKKVATMRVEMPVFKKSGVYYWRVSQGKKNQSFVANFSVISANAISLIAPKNNECLAILTLQ